MQKDDYVVDANIAYQRTLIERKEGEEKENAMIVEEYNTKEAFAVELTIDATDRVASVMDKSEIKNIIDRALSKAFNDFHVKVKDIIVKDIS